MDAVEEAQRCASPTPTADAAQRAKESRNSLSFVNSPLDSQQIKDNTGIPTDTEALLGISKSMRNDRIDQQVDQFLVEREAIIRFVQDSIGHAVDRQKMNADRHGRKNQHIFNVGDYFLPRTYHNMQCHV